MRQHKVPFFFPILINIDKFPCLVVGGGKVAYRKVLSLKEFKADVTLISPKYCKPLVELAKEGKINIINKSYSKEYIKDFKIVFSATNNPKINKTVHKDCQSEGILLNVVDNLPLCDFILPANVKRGSLTISISSQGKAPFYLKEIKKKLIQLFPLYYADIIELADNFRKQLLSNPKIRSPKLKEKAFKKFLEIDWEYILTEENKKNLHMHLQKILQEFN